jgi:uncharacterized membrane protein
MNVPVAAALEEWLHVLHVVAAMVWVGGAVTLMALTIQVLRSGDGEAVSRFVDAVRVIGPLVLAPATVAVAGFGIWLVIDSEAWSFGQTWVWLGLALLVGAVVVGAVFQSLALIRAQRASEAGDDREAADQLRRWSRGLMLILLILLVATWDMVVKPGL